MHRVAREVGDQSGTAPAHLGAEGRASSLMPQATNSSPTVGYGRSYGAISVSGSGLTVNGDVYNYGIRPDDAREQHDVIKLGLCLGAAPQTDSEQFIGRAAEIDHMVQILQPGQTCTKQQRLVLGGLGGVGKTQLAVTYAERYRDKYDSILWLNATSESTLETSVRLLAGRLVKAKDLEQLNNEQVLAQTHEWLSNPKNARWLLLLDNYDEPEQYNIAKYCPYTAHGAIIITTRLPDLVPISNRSLRVHPLTDVEESLDILQTRSRRANVRDDPNAHSLARRLDGLPLALATAGAYLGKCASMTFQQYLEVYNQRWQVDKRRPLRLQDYHLDRTLYTTWDLSYNRLLTDDPLAAHMLKLLAYFDNQDVWYELFRMGLDDDSPQWIQEMCTERVDFESTMGTLVEYCLVEVRMDAESYSIHSCVQDWTLSTLNQTIDSQLYWYSLSCVSASTGRHELNHLQELCYARWNRHAIRLSHLTIAQDTLVHTATPNRLRDMVCTAGLLSDHKQFSAAEYFYRQALGGFEQILESRSEKYISAMLAFAGCYYDQGKIVEASQMWTRALADCEEILGLVHPLTLRSVVGVGLGHHEQDQFDQAEQMYKRALTLYESAPEPMIFTGFNLFNDLGILYDNQGERDKAEKMYTRALAGYDRGPEVDHISTLKAADNLGRLHAKQRNFELAEKMYTRALTGFEERLGPNHALTLDTVDSLGGLHAMQGNFEVAEKMYIRAAAGFEKVLGQKDGKTGRAKQCLANLYLRFGKLDVAERIYQPLLEQSEKLPGPMDLLNIFLIRNMGILYLRQGRLSEAKTMFERALTSCRSKFGETHEHTVDIKQIFAYHWPAQDEAEEAQRCEEDQSESAKTAEQD